ncbi:uncharacterized protein TM35_000151450 [Trypanosoma theileri]|uniref:Uncharacterized protein n=1 Tax=Trypanosoma theileri TaxID=67003 RepID=A0A1X0NVI0_9TRYP|nr:uncharacterized protein TM35_000151450 [Trypanosoma theileri]ORC88714.1 hypothetical protein TM35_000151450 [Trypanosoma theileri]
MRGKRVAPVDYSAYISSQQGEQSTFSHYTVCNRTVPYIIWDATETSPLFSSFSRNGYDPHMTLRWLRGKNEFDRQLASSRHHAFVLQRREEMEKVRQKLLHQPDAETVIRASLLAEEKGSDVERRGSAWTQCDTTLTNTDDSCYNNNNNNNNIPAATRSSEGSRLFSGRTFMPNIKSNGTTGSVRPYSATNTTATTTKRRTVCSSVSSGDSIYTVRSAVPRACVRHSCLVVQDSTKLPATMGFVSEVCLDANNNNTVDDLDNNNNNNNNNKSNSSNCKKEKKNKKKQKENRINIVESLPSCGLTDNIHLSRFYDARLMRVLRESTATC